MSKFFNIKISFCVVVIIASLVILTAPRQAMAFLCPQVGTPCVGTGTVNALAQTVKGAIETHEQTIKQAIDNHVRAINRQLNRTTRAIVRATNSVSRNYTNGIGNLGTRYAKTRDAGVNQRIVHDQNKDNLRVSRGLAITASDCRQASNAQYKPAATVLTHSVKKVRDRKSIRRHSNAVGTPGARGSIAAKASRYRDYVEKFCDPDEPNMTDECTHNSNLKGSLASAAGFMDAITMKGPESEEYIDMAMEMINPNNSDRIALPDFNKVGRGGWWPKYANAIKKAVIDSNINAMTARKAPVANAKNQYVAIANASLGLAGAAAGSAEALAEHNTENIGTESGQISLAEMQRIEAENASNLYGLVDIQKMGDEALGRMSIAELQKNVRQKYEMFQSLQRQNLVLSIAVAEKIN